MPLSAFSKRGRYIFNSLSHLHSQGDMFVECFTWYILFSVIFFRFAHRKLTNILKTKFVSIDSFSVLNYSIGRYPRGKEKRSLWSFVCTNQFSYQFPPPPAEQFLYPGSHRGHQLSSFLENIGEEEDERGAMQEPLADSGSFKRPKLNATDEGRLKIRVQQYISCMISTWRMIRYHK